MEFEILFKDVRWGDGDKETMENRPVVRVCLSAWFGAVGTWMGVHGELELSHYLLTTFVRVDDDNFFQNSKVFPYRCNNGADMIRAAIAEFEKLCAAHPDTKISEG